MKIDWPSSHTSSVVTSVLFFEGMPAFRDAELISGWTFISTRPRWSTDGVTFRITPDSRNWMLSVVTRLIVVVTR